MSPSAMHKIPMPRPGTSLQLSHLHGGVVTYRRGESLQPRTLHDWELVLILEGRVSYLCNGVDRQARPGAVLLGRPGFHEHYRWDTQRSTRHAYFHFGITHVPRDWPKMERWPILQNQPDPVVPTLFRHVLRLCDLHQRWPAQIPTRKACCFVETLIDCLLAIDRNRHPKHTQAPDARRPEPLQRCLQWMRQRLEEEPEHPIQLQDLATAANLSSKHLCRVFSKQLNHSPMEILRLLRLQLAVTLLARSDLTIKQVAARCGFQSPYHFSRCFHQAMGEPPTSARVRMRRGGPPPAAVIPQDLMPRAWW